MRGLVLCLMLASCARWTKTDTVLEAAFIATTAIDWHQTMSITHDCQEINPVIGRCGDGAPPNLYFPVVFVLHAAVAALLPHPWREIFQGFTIGLEASTIYSNYESGE
jgi:hypothetical protein